MTLRSSTRRSSTDVPHLTYKGIAMRPLFFPNTSRSLRARALGTAVLCATFVLPPSISAGAAPAPTVEITKFAFAPKEVTVQPGTKIVWINHDETPHTVASNDKSFT